MTCRFGGGTSAARRESRASGDLEVRDGFLGDGYAAATAESLAAVALAEANHIHLETTYTGKALAVLVADARTGKLVGKTALFWNTYNSR